ncbi:MULTISPECIES: hypothetical protein [unclassified Moorena]|nr:MULTISPECIES: hypothetical protein [unclassified Moorena]
MAIFALQEYEDAIAILSPSQSLFTTGKTLTSATTSGRAKSRF